MKDAMCRCVVLSKVCVAILGGFIVYLFNCPQDDLDDDLSGYKKFPYQYHEIFPDFNDNNAFIKKVKKCGWVKRNFTPLYNYSKDGICKRIIRYANRLNITYFLSFGTELQAYRNNGIYNDHDIDIMVPIWLNPHLFNCSDYIPINRKKYKFNSIVLEHTYRLCGRRRRHYFKRFIRYIKKRMGYYDIGLHSYSLHIHMGYMLPFLDVWFIMSNEYVYDKIDICKCEFCGIESYCTRNIVENIIRNNGKDFMTPKKDSGEYPYIISTPD